MSHWDFGRPADGQHDRTRPSEPSGAYLTDPYLADPAGGPGDWAWPADDVPAARDERGTPGGRPADEDPAGGPVPADGHWPAAGAWPADEGLADDGFADEEDMAPYPLTYERDDFAVSGPRPERAPWQPSPPALFPGGPDDADTKVWAGDGYEEREPGSRPRRAARRGRRDAAWAGQGPGLPEDGPEDWACGGAGPGRRRWLIPAAVVMAGAAAGAAVLMLAGNRPPGHGGAAVPSAAPAAAGRTAQAAAPPAATAPPSPAAPLTVAQARAVLAGYTTANNSANAQRSDTLLATVETGSSYAIDAGLYRAQQAAGTAPYPAFGPARATYYIPRSEPAAGPRWFVAQVANAFTADPGKVTSGEYLLFTQPAPGAAWQDAVEPYLLPGAAAPAVAVGADGLATAVSPAAAAVAVAPGQLAAATAASLDGTSQAVADPGNLADRGDQRFWQGKVPGGTVTDTHGAAAGADGQEFALRTADGGALVFYTDTAEVTITPPAGSVLHLTVPGFYSPAQALTRATVGYLEQFAAYDPPAGRGTARVVADYSAITGRN